jgi:tetratricopeptide (TPR) repeat protein
MENQSIRPGYIPYLLATAVLLTAGSALSRTGMLLPAFVCLLLTAIVVMMAMLDRIRFDGQTVSHRGPLAFILSKVFRLRRQIYVSEIEAITTSVISLGISGGNARMNYRTRVQGAGIEILLRSHRANYIPFIKSLFKVIGPSKLDPLSYDLFEYFESSNSLKDTPVLRSEISVMPTSLLRRVANALRLAGRLAQASSYFRIAYEKEPRNAELLYEMSRFFRSSAHASDPKLLQRSDACLRLASRLADTEPGLLERIGEAFCERLDYKRASECFNRALSYEPTRFRSNLGLAEIALRSGKFAHVAHCYRAASTNPDQTLASLAEREARYYERLVIDDDFLEMEARRARAYKSIRGAQRLSMAAFFTAWLMAIIVGRFNFTLEQFGWALMASTGFVWCMTTMTLRLLRRNLA